MDTRHPVAADQASDAQLALELEVRLDLPVAVQDLAPGERFLLESCGIEGRVISCGPSGAVVSIRGADDDHWIQTRWSLQTKVRRLQA